MRRNSTQASGKWQVASKKKFLLMTLVLLVSVFCFLTFASAYAYTVPTKENPPPNAISSGKVCEDYNDGKGLTIRLIPCIRDSVVFATSQILVPFSEYLAKTIVVICTLAIVVWGIMVMQGQPAQISTGGLILGLKIGGVVLFTHNFGNMYPAFLNIIEQLLNIVASPLVDMVSDRNCQAAAIDSKLSDAKILGVWRVVDCYLDMLVGGVFSDVNFKNGIVAFLVGLIFSSAVGLFIAIVGFCMLFLLLMTIGRALYILLSSYIAFSVMVLVSPLFIPLIVFKSTKSYFDKWVILTLNFMVQPIFLMGFLVMFLIAFNNTIFGSQHYQHSLCHAIAGDKCNSEDFKLGVWLQNKGVYTEKSVNPLAVKANYQEVVEELTKTGDKPKSLDTGVADKRGVYTSGFTDVLGAIAGTTDPSDPAAKKAKKDYFRMDIPVDVVDLDKLVAAGATDDDKTKYKIKVFFGFLMALVIMYIFFSMLEYMPFIGSGALDGGDLGRITLGSGRLSAPGSSQRVQKLGAR